MAQYQATIHYFKDAKNPSKETKKHVSIIDAEDSTDAYNKMRDRMKRKYPLCVIKSSSFTKL